MSDGTGIHFVFVRYWPGFSDFFPYSEFAGAEDGQIHFGLRRRLVIELWSRYDEIRERLVALDQRCRERRSQCIPRPGRRTGPSTESPSPRKRHGYHERFRLRARVVDWQVPLIDTSELISAATGDIDRLISPRICVARVGSNTQAQQIAAQLADLKLSTASDYKKRIAFNPRYSVLRGSSMPEPARREARGLLGQLLSDRQLNHWGELTRQLHPELRSLANEVVVDDNNDAFRAESETPSGTASDLKGRPAGQRIIVSLAPPQVTLDGTPIALTDDEATCVDHLLTAKDWKSSRAIGREASIARADKIITGLRTSKLKGWAVIETSQFGSRICPSWLN